VQRRIRRSRPGSPTTMPWESGEGESLCDRDEKKNDMSEELRGMIRRVAGEREGASPSRAF